MNDARLRRAFRQGYGTGLAVAVLLPLLFQIALGPLATDLRPLLQEALRQQLGYIFTGLTLLGSLILIHRMRALRRTLGQWTEPSRARRLRRELLLASGLCTQTALWGLLYLALGGPDVLRHARGFLLLAPLQFLALVPRYATWAAAVDPAQRRSSGAILNPPPQEVP